MDTGGSYVVAVAYAARSNFVLNAEDLFEGTICATVVPEERAVDIDTELNPAFAEFLLERRRR